MAKYYLFCSKSSELVQIKTRYYKVYGLPEEFDGIDLIAHQDPGSIAGWWSVTHVLSGHRIAKGKDRKTAVARAIDMLAQVGRENTDKAIKQAMARVAAGAETA